jgi:hypothetical protein
MFSFDAGAVAALLAGVPYSWSALVTYLNARHAKRTGALDALYFARHVKILSLLLGTMRGCHNGLIPRQFCRDSQWVYGCSAQGKCTTICWYPWPLAHSLWQFLRVHWAITYMWHFLASSSAAPARPPTPWSGATRQPTCPDLPCPLAGPWQIVFLPMAVRLSALISLQMLVVYDALPLYISITLLRSSFH